MSEEHTFRGLWWLPERPEKQIPGQLTLTVTNKASLDLQGALIDLDWNSDFNPSLILGLSQSGQQITLYKCYLSSHMTHSSSGLSSMMLGAQMVFIGVHFHSEKELRFKGLSIRYAHLEEWLSRHDFQVDYRDGNNHLVLEYKQPSRITMRVDDYNIGIAARHSTSSSHSEFKITQNAWIDLWVDADKTIDEYLKMVYHIQNFLSLAMDAPAYPLELHGQTEANKEILDDGREFYPPVEVRYQIADWRIDERTVHSFEMLFTLPIIQDQVGTYLGNWISKSESLKPVYNLYFSTFYNPHQYLESKFLSLAQAIETYHRRQIGGKYQTDVEYQNNLYQRFVDVIPPDLDKAFKQSLREGKLRFANEYSLRKRLREIMDKVSSYMHFGFIASKDSVREFIDNVCDTRNYLTHYDPELKLKTAEGADLVRLAQRLKAILGICLLEEMALPSETIKDIVSRNRSYQFLLR